MHFPTYKHENYTKLMQIKLFYCIKIYRNSIKIHQNEKVQKDVINASKISLLNETKNNNTSSQMLLDTCYAFGLLRSLSV